MNSESGYGDGYGYGSGDGYGDGAGYGSGDGDGYGDGMEQDQPFLRTYCSLAAASGTLTAAHALREENAELKRIMIEYLGPDRFFRDSNAVVVHQDIDGIGNQRRLLRIPLVEAEAGYLQAVHVVCPTTGHNYYLGVQPDVKTCQEAVASTFGLKASEYQLVRES